MSSPGPQKGQPWESDERLDRIIALYLQEVESGRTPDRKDLTARYPDLAEDLEAFFANQDFIRGLDPQAGRYVEEGGTAPTDAGEECPRTFGDYEILQELSSSSMGRVCRARQFSTDRIVAIKVFPGAQHASPDDSLRFQLEAKAIAGLDHPNIVPLYVVGESQGQPYFTMKFIEGGSLADHLPYFLGDPRAAASLIEVVAMAVHHAHERGILHRDLKPANILVDLDGRPYVSDFGLAKRIEEDGSSTHPGALVGSPSYMAPEQAAPGKGSVTTVSDVYSLGAILYELLTGQPPFRGETLVRTLEKVIHNEPPRPSQINPEVPGDLETICLKCLQKEPRSRYQSAAELAADLRRYLSGEVIHAFPAAASEQGLK